MRKLFILTMAAAVLVVAAGCKKSLIDISVNDLKKSLPDVAYNSENNNFFVFWAAAPGGNSATGGYAIFGQKISSAGRLMGEPVEIATSGTATIMPRALYNPHKNQYLVVYGIMDGYMNLWGVILDKDGKKVGSPFRVTDVKANQFHYTMAFNALENEFCIVYNDSRNGAGDVFGVIYDETGGVVQNEFVISSATGHQVNPVVCHNPEDDTYLVNWEDFRYHGDNLTAYGTLDVMTNIEGALLDSDGTVLVKDIEMCVDDLGADGDQRFNGIAYNAEQNEFLVSWSDTRDSLQNAGIVGRVVASDGSMPAGDFPLVDAAGAQMIGHTHYLPEHDAYFVAFEQSDDDLDEFYFKDITAQLDIAAQWLGGDGTPEGSLVDIYDAEGNQRFVRFAHNPRNDTFLLVWQDDFPGVSDTVDGHIMSAGGDIKGKIYAVE